MALISEIMFNMLVFLSVYVQVFFFVTFLENRKKIVTRKGKIKLKKYPSVTIVVPCWNEERTVYRTIRSLLAINYPKDKLKIFLVDDGSTDGTFSILDKFKKYKNIKTFHKENGGKYTALNLGLEQSDTEFFGCLDADSYADPEALIRIMSYFERDSSAMAVTPSVIVISPRNIIESAQRAEYHMGVFLKKMLSFLGAINVTPGPLTIFRRKVFNDLGPYRHGHNTEDMEIAYRMQKNLYKIDHCNDAYVYTSIPSSIGNLHRQRLRWIYGFLNNTIDYKSVLFKRKYGNFAIFTLPTGLISALSVGYLFSKIVYNLGDFIYSKFIEIQTVGLSLTTKAMDFDLFFLSLRSSLFLMFLVYVLVAFTIVFGRKMAEGKWTFSMDIIYFFPIFAVIAPFWLLRAFYNTIISRKPSWR